MVAAVTMILLFGGFYAWGSGRISGMDLGLVLLIAFVIVSLRISRWGRELREFSDAHTDTVGKRARGELAQAREVMWAWSERTGSFRIAAIARHDLGWTMLRQGDLEHAAAVLADVDSEYLDQLAQTGMAATNAADLALVHALRGDLTEAARWLACADERRSASRRPSIGAMISFSRAVLLCRSGRPEEAATLLDGGWADYEATSSGDLMRPLRVVRAFAHAVGPRSGGVALAALPMVRPNYPGEHAFLGTNWPEMEAFLATHELAG